MSRAHSSSRASALTQEFRGRGADDHVEKMESVSVEGAPESTRQCRLYPLAACSKAPATTP